MGDVGAFDDPLIPATYQSEWALFVDWCAAFDVESLPASPITVATFLATENPHASRRVWRRRASAINAVHRDAGFTAPGTSTAVRRLLSTRVRHITAARERIRGLPVTGWPAGLFGRRDAVVLWLVCVVGIPASELGNLRCADLTMPTVQMVRIGGGHEVEYPIDPDDPFGLLPTWKRWIRVRNIMATQPGTTPLVRPLTNAKPVDPQIPPTLTPPPAAARPGYALIPALDQWGNLQSLPGHDDEGLSGPAVTALINAHLHDRRPRRGTGRSDRWLRQAIERSTPAPEPVAVVEPEVPALPDHHQLGVQARKRAQAVFDGVDDTFADIDRRTAEILERTEQILAGLE